MEETRSVISYETKVKRSKTARVCLGYDFVIYNATASRLLKKVSTKGRQINIFFQIGANHLHKGTHSSFSVREDSAERKIGSVWMRYLKLKQKDSADSTFAGLSFSQVPRPSVRETCKFVPTQVIFFFLLTLHCKLMYLWMTYFKSRD